MPKKVVQFSRIGTVTFSKNKRSKNIKISVKPNKTVLVSFPFFVRTSEAVNFLLQNEDWIKQQQSKFQVRKPKYTANTEIKTKLHNVVFLKGAGKKAESKDSTVEITVDDFGSEPSEMFIENILTEIYRFEAKVLLPRRIREIAEYHGFKYQKITIRNNKRNWGSCSSKNNISLNLQMMKLPDELIDYILMHELVHTKIKNHGPKFWDELNRLSGGRARDLAKQIKQYSTYSS